MQRIYYYKETLGIMEGVNFIEIKEFTGRCQREVDNNGFEKLYYEVVVGYTLFCKRPKIKWIDSRFIKKHDYYPVTECDKIDFNKGGTPERWV